MPSGKSSTDEIRVSRSLSSHAHNMLLVECLGKDHRLSAIHVKEIELVFDSDQQVEYMSDGKLKRTEKSR
jgi:hypothetical protein